MNPLLTFGLLCAGSMLALAGVLHLVPRLGGIGRGVATMCCRAPGLDLVVFAFTTAPQVAGIALAMARGGSWLDALAYLGVSVVAQFVALATWSILHELANRSKTRGPRILTSLNRIVGPVRNIAAVYWTALAVPIFTAIRLGELIVYPPLTWLVRLPRYRAAEWVNVTRQKYDGLVGHDLIWCLYCDWMTGVWSLGSEMLRNVESFWCPIRFGSPEKCENCRHDFPDVAGGWAPERGSIADAARVVDAHYPGPGGENSWFGHPTRLTVEGREPDAEAGTSRPPRA